MSLLAGSLTRSRAIFCDSTDDAPALSAPRNAVVSLPGVAIVKVSTCCSSFLGSDLYLLASQLPSTAPSATALTYSPGSPAAAQPYALPWL